MRWRFVNSKRGQKSLQHWKDKTLKQRVLWMQLSGSSWSCIFHKGHPSSDWRIELTSPKDKTERSSFGYGLQEFHKEGKGELPLILTLQVTSDFKYFKSVWVGRATSESRQYTEPYTDGLKYMTFTKTSFALGTGLLNWGRVIHLFKYFVARWQKEAPWHLNKFSLPLAISAAYVLCLISHFSILIFRRKKIFLEKSEDKIHNKIPGRKKIIPNIIQD